MDKESKEKLIKKLHSDMQEISTSKSSAEVFKNIEFLLCDVSNSDYATLYTYDNKNSTLYGHNGGAPLSMINVEGCIGKVYLTKKPAIYNHVISDKDYVPKYDNPSRNKLKSLMLLPLVNKDALVGIISVSRAIKSDAKYYTQEDMNILLSIDSYLMNLISKSMEQTFTKNNNLVSTNVEKKIKCVLDEDDENTIDNKALFSFFSNTVHDIRTPANNLFGFLELLEEEIDDLRLKEYVSNAKESALYINDLTDQILIQTKYKHEVSIAKPEIVNTVEFLSAIINVFTAKMSQKNINYFLSIAPNLPKEIKLETTKLKRVLINLIGNAYKFTPKNKRIDIFITYDESTRKMKISIKDQGIGIAKENQSKLFKAYSQATDDTSIEYGGTGLGLSISASFVKELGGNLELISDYGKGCEFYFDIPLEVINAAPIYEKFFNLEKHIVILTEDLELINANYIKNFLQKLGMPKEKIHISNKVLRGTTHIICFEHKMTDELIEYAKTNNIELLLIEENLFSLLKDDRLDKFNIASKNAYCEHLVYSTVYSGNKVKILIVDDNKINIALLKSILSTEYVELESCLDGKSALKQLKKATKNDVPYDMVFLDKHMPEMSGTEVLKEYRKFELKHQVNSVHAVSISGDPDISDDEKSIFNTFANKPFDKSEIRKIIANYLAS